MAAFEEMSPNSRVWIYQADKEFLPEQEKEILKEGEKFISSWAAHGQKLKASFNIFYHRFIVIVVDEAQAMASGCSIDKCVHFMQQLEKQFSLSLLDRMNIAYKADDKVRSCSLPEFNSKIAKGEISENTIVFNNLVTSKAEFDKGWETPLKNSWHKQLL